MVGSACTIDGFSGLSLTGQDEQLSPLLASSIQTEPANWPSNGRTPGEDRFSPLSQITDENVNELGLAWSYDTGTDRGLEATPVVIDGVMYTSGSWSVVIALDAATGEELWRFDPGVDEIYDSIACCDVVNRGVAVYNRKVYVGVLDGRLIALDTYTGEPVWETMTVDQNRFYSVTGAPRIVKGQVIIGNGGAEYGVRGYVSAYDAETGELNWRFYTIPGDFMAPGTPKMPPDEAAMTLAAETWAPKLFGRQAAAGLHGIRLPTTPSLIFCISESAMAPRGISNTATQAAATIYSSRRSSRLTPTTGPMFGITKPRRGKRGTTPPPNR